VSITFGAITGIKELAVFSVVWFVSFKYWETSRQLSRFLYAYGADMNEGHSAWSSFSGQNKPESLQ